LAHGFGIDAPNQLEIDLDDVRLKLGQQVQAGISGAEIIDRGSEVMSAIFFQNAAQMGAIDHLFALGHLEDQSVAGKADPAGGGQRRLYAGIGPIDGE
jgi:hypothetical protein